MSKWVMASSGEVIAQRRRVTDEVKYDWYQTDTHVIIEILQKAISNVEVRYNFDKVDLNYDLSDGAHLEKIFDLSGSIDVPNCNHQVFPSKVHVKLKKADSQRWTQLLSEQATSSKFAVTRNWDDLVAKIEAEESDNENGAVNSLFQKIYSQGSDEVKKAMNKSFVESGGTVLSTNWDNVKQDKVQMKPLDGLEWKPWNEK